MLSTLSGAEEFAVSLVAMPPYMMATTLFSLFCHVTSMLEIRRHADHVYFNI